MPAKWLRVMSDKISHTRFTTHHASHITHDIGVPLLVGAFSVLLTFQMAWANPPTGIAPLLSLSDEPISSLIQDGVRSLIDAEGQEAFLRDLDQTPPNWEPIRHLVGEEHDEYLFALNRQRDAAREGHSLLQERIAFLWSGLLRRYQAEHHGFVVAIGPELTPTRWGIVRFKPVGLPNEMVAIPSPDHLPSLQRRVAAGEHVDIGVLFTGHLIPRESVIYGISHDGSEQGMVMPVVEIEQVDYFLKLSE